MDLCLGGAKSQCQVKCISTVQNLGCQTWDAISLAELDYSAVSLKTLEESFNKLEESLSKLEQETYEFAKNYEYTENKLEQETYEFAKDCEYTEDIKIKRCTSNDEQRKLRKLKLAKEQLRPPELPLTQIIFCFQVSIMRSSNIWGAKKIEKKTSIK